MTRINNIDESSGYSMFERAKRKLSATNTLTYLPDVEYDLLQQGITKEHFNGATITEPMLLTLASQTNCRYILEVAVVSTKNGNAIGSYTPTELNPFNLPRNQEDETDKAKLQFKLIDTKSHITVNTFHVNTSVGPLIIKEDDGGETRINPKANATPVWKAFDKGIKQLKKGVIKMN